MRRHPVGEIWRHQRQRDLDARVARPFAQAQAEPADANSVNDFADHDQREGAGGLRRRKRAGAHRQDREAIEDQRGCVIDETFAFQHDQQPAWQAKPPDDGERRHHVGRRNDGAEHESNRPFHADQVVHGGRHRAGGEHHAAEGEQRDRPQVKAEFAPAHGDAGGIDQRRQDHQQHQFRRQRHLRQARNQRHADAGDDQQDRRRNGQPFGGNSNRGQYRQHEQNGLHRRGHRRCFKGHSLSSR